VKIIHFSDTHLGFSDFELTTKRGINQREADFYHAFEEVIDAILEKKPSYVIHTGDLFHRVSPSNRAITFALLQFKRLEKANIPLIIIAGNHSTPRTSNSTSILALLQVLENVTAVFSQHYEAVVCEEVVFHALPHINDERIIEGELDKIEANIDPQKRNILMMHCSVGAHYLMHEFGEWVYPKTREALFEKMDYVALGHWHGFGAVGNYSHVYYAGSTERTSRTDRRRAKGYVEVVLEKDKALEVTHHTIALRNALCFHIDAENYVKEVARLDVSESEGALVEVVLYHLTPSTSLDFHNEEIKAYFPNALHVSIRREFKSVEVKPIESDMESLSLEGYFLSHIEESTADRAEAKRLSKKAKELFARYTERAHDTH